MLYYTSINPAGEIESTYNGRFAFIHFREYEEYKAIQALRNNNDLKGLWTEDHETNAAVRILAHEYTHKNIFSRSATGLMLNGYRYWVRWRFLFFGDKKCVADYYRMRAIYLMETKPYHETIARALDGKMALPDQCVDSVFEKSIKEHHEVISGAEKRISDKWESLGLHQKGLRKMFNYHFGRWLQANFSVKVSLRNMGEKCVYDDIADQGISNDIYGHRPNEKWFSRLKKTVVLRCLVLPITRLETFDDLLEWYWTGQRAQFDLLQSMYKIDYDRFWQEILRPSVFFIQEWAGVSLEHRPSLMEISEDTLQMDKGAFMTRWKDWIDRNKTEPDVQLFFTFFLHHGN